MPLQLLLLLILLGPGSGLQRQETGEDGATGTPGPLLVRGRRQVTMVEDITEDEDYTTDGTDSPEMLEDSTGTVPLSHKLLAVMGTSGLRDSAGPGTPEPTTLEAATGDSAGLDGGATTVGNLSTELATQVSVTLGPLTKALVTATLPFPEALSTGLATVGALSTEPAATEALTTQPAATEALTMESTVMKVLSTGPSVKEALSTDPATSKAPSTGPATTRGINKPLLVPSDPHRSTTMAESNSSAGPTNPWENSQSFTPPSSVAPNPTVAWDYVPVKQCLLAILILALLATIFLVCTVVLAVRLSRKSHMYPVRNYSPTEMVCISSLLPEGGEGPAATANGGLPTTNGRGPKAGPREDRDGDDLTLHSFLP
ncbi:P-selectin glycoprotein ligand 1 isoform X2 [Diceros bicornis minor]|uniref:P-selectin glycoprotein ligand 1 n=2 Tax=Diceros bicornis minor TaxID=77932 RepID=A0A7J7FMA1_DICBM|nr:P-selectin glycoprotein ligand 1 isoform X2 [Diceros bicornis minor]XP_058387636.1 P-selectin glycoprotein ligand 1 isoform X2 [Diceros bicornis minor]KAF5929190.1 hypothetical protein HPG69_019211 [Diceros bicornis minor]